MSPEIGIVSGKALTFSFCCGLVARLMYCVRGGNANSECVYLLFLSCVKCTHEVFFLRGYKIARILVRQTCFTFPGTPRNTLWISSSVIPERRHNTALHVIFHVIIITSTYYNNTVTTTHHLGTRLICVTEATMLFFSCSVKMNSK